MTILMVDDDQELCVLIQSFLAHEGYDVCCTHDGITGLQMAQQGSFDLMILDMMLPGKNGMDLLRELRQTSPLPTLMLTARGDDMDRILGLELGADDYLPKPCNPRELAARIRAILRRTQALPMEQHPPTQSIGALVWHPKSRQFFLQERALTLTSTEYDLLALLITHHGEVISKEQVSQSVLGRKHGIFDRSLDVHITNLRKKLSVHPYAPVIQTIRSIGWVLIEPMTDHL